MRSRKLLALLFCLITFPAIAGYMTLLGAGVGSIAPVVSWVSGTDAFPSSSLTYSGPSLSTMFDSTGKLTYAPNNLLLNTETLSTQSVNLAANTNYILTYYGTGSVALSGTASGTPSGTNPSYVKFASSGAGSATFTVTGSVTNASLAAVTYETTPRTADQVITTSSAYYGPRIDYDPNTLAVKGLLIEEARTNLLTQATDLSNAAWIGTAAAVTGGQATGPDGTSSLAKIRCSTGGATVQSYQIGKTTTASPYTGSVVAKAGNLTWIIVNVYDGTVNNRVWVNLSTGAVGTTAGGSTVAVQNLGGGLWRIAHTRTMPVTANAGVAVELADGDGVSTTASTSSFHYAGFAQFEAGSFATSYIPTAAASVTRAADVVQFTGAALTALQGGAGSALVEISKVNVGTTAQMIVGAGMGVFPLYVGNGTTGKVKTNNGTTVLETSTAPTQSSPFRSAVAWSGSGRSLVYNGGTVATDGASFGTIASAYLGVGNAGTQYWINGWIKSFAIYNQRLPDATLQAKSVVGASYAANDNGLRFADNLTTGLTLVTATASSDLTVSYY